MRFTSPPAVAGRDTLDSSDLRLRVDVTSAEASGRSARLTVVNRRRVPARIDAARSSQQTARGRRALAAADVSMPPGFRTEFIWPLRAILPVEPPGAARGGTTLAAVQGWNVTISVTWADGRRTSRELGFEAVDLPPEPVRLARR
ncbi:MAG: hypothetical protein U1A27_00455 [Phycisphaerae bacterium]